MPLLNGGAIYSESDLDISRSVFSENEGGSGGAIYAEMNTVNVDNSTFYKNYATRSGGAIHALKVNVNSNQNPSESFTSFFISNTARSYSGGAICGYNEGYPGSKIKVINAFFSGNSAELNGGAIYSYYGNATITHCYFDSNKAYEYHGGAVYYPHLTVDNSTFINNWCDEDGGAIWANDLTIKQTPSYFENNYASRGKGGAIYTDKFAEDIKYASFIGNKAAMDAWTSDDGGAIYINMENHITFSQCVFVNNHCTDEGGAIYLDSRSSHLTLVNNIFRGNKADDEGQAVFNCGYYDKINNNWWGGKNPSSGNDQLIEWKIMPWESNVGHSDSNPLSMHLGLLGYACDVNDTVRGQVWFETPNGNNFIGDLWGLDALDLSSSPDMKSNIDNVGVNSVVFSVMPEKEAIYTLNADLYGYSLSTILYAVNATIIAPEISTAKGVPATFNIHIEGNKSFVSNQEVIVILNSNEYKTVTDENGDANVILKDVNTLGNHEIIIYTMGQFAMSYINVYSSVDASNLVKIYRNATQFEAVFKDSKGEYLTKGTEVSFDVNGVTYNRSIINDEGVARLNINLEPGEYEILSTNKLTNESSSNNVTVLSKVFNNNDLLKFYQNDSQFVVQVRGDDGNIVTSGNVTFNINGVFYTRAIDETGYAKLNINLEPGDYIVTAQYDNCNSSNQVIVKSLFEPQFNSYDNGIYTIKLLDKQGNPNPNQNVEFNINGVFYSAISDSQGFATVKLNLMKGTYIITSIYDGLSISETIEI